ncbi:MAG TPA: hypothetical protein PKY35_05495 [Candidatus Hydrogenedentes bacterium]|nr:hypothetical protein [Candidatus Hydrogenedentota bacterium]HOL76465.1 hypothetical protein [Candidatus Hydrogenedentota bacterium]HPO85505.1 hypothetical protein [Candidatus Hydrogenedentota bacterium]
MAKSKMMSLVVLAGLTAGLLVGCPLLLKFVLTVENYTGEDITALYLRPGNSASWGTSVITDPIAGDGAPYAVQIDYGMYDLKAVFTTPSIVRFNVPFTDSDWRWIFSAIEVGEGEYTTVQVIDTLVAE